MASITGTGSQGLPHEVHALLFKWGANATVGASFETIWTGSTLYGTTPAYLSGDTSLDIVSSAGGDTMGVTVVGTNAAGTEISQSTTLNGVNRVQLASQLKRVYRVYLAANTSNAGTVTVVDRATGALVYARIEIGAVQTQMAMSTIPAVLSSGAVVTGAELLWLHVTERAVAGVNVRLTVNGVTKDDIVLASGDDLRRDYGSDGVVGSGIPLAVGDDIEVRGQRTGGGDASVAAMYKVRYFTG